MRKLGFVLAVSLAACGGGGAKYKVDDVALANISLADKQPVFAAEHEVSIAKAEQAKAQADQRDVDGQIDIADKELEQAKLETAKAKLTVDQAEKSHDMNRVASAQKDLRTAETGERAADAKTDWLSKLRKFHKQMQDVGEAHVQAAQSKVELEKARLAAAKGIKPSADFKLDDYANDYAKRTKAWDEEKKDADQIKAQADKLQQAYNNLQSQYASLRAPQQPPPTQPAPAQPQTADAPAPSQQAPAQ